MYRILFYDYVDDILERRGPHREAHLAAVGKLRQEGMVVMGGAFADPVDGAVIVFNTENRSTIEAFVAEDPYVVNGLVTHWRIRDWNVVVAPQ
jgi:uncharacterized protein YciI